VRVLLDTHAVLWWVLGNPRLSKTASNMLSQRNISVLVSAVSGHEIATKHRLGKLPVPLQLAENLEGTIAANGFQCLALSMAHAQLVSRLQGVHRDPFDRMLAAQALIENVQLVTNDSAFAAFGVRTLW
jgi:PIN domain nuclease of toxin-antitoxin system